MSVLLILVLVPLALVLVLTIAAVASSPPASHLSFGGVQTRAATPGMSRRSSDSAVEQEPPVVIAAGFQ